MDSSLSVLVETLRGEVPGGTVSSLGLTTYNDILRAANRNTNAAPRESHAIVQPSIPDHHPDVQPMGLALTVQSSTPGDIPESVPIEPALDGSQLTGQLSKPGNHQQYRSSVNQIGNANGQLQAAGNWISRPPPGSTVPIQVPPRRRRGPKSWMSRPLPRSTAIRQAPPRSRDNPRISRVSRWKDARERNWRQRRQIQQQRPLVAVGTPPASSQLPSSAPRRQKRRSQQIQHPKLGLAQPLITPNPTQAAQTTNASQYHPHNSMGVQQSMGILSFSDVDQHGQQELGGKRKADQYGQEQTKRQHRRRAENSNLEEQIQEFNRAIKHLEDEFTEKERISYTKNWCKPVPCERNVSTVMGFYQAFHNMDTLPIHTCMICYQKISTMEIKELSWEEWVNSKVMNRCRTYSCPDCFPVGKAIPSCENCAMKIRECNVARGGNLHQALGCEHIYPDALRDLTLIEEKLIALNTHFGIVARIKVTKSSKQSTAYARHVKGHISVFPNSVQDLATTVLPHPLLQSLEDIHISWYGP